MLYYPDKANVVLDTLSRVKYVNRLVRLGVRLMSILDSGVIFLNGEESYYVVDVEEKKDSDPILLELTVALHNQGMRFCPKGRWCSSLPRYIVCS